MNNKFQVVYADPPWSYNDKMKAHGGAADHYNTMSIEDIKNLPVNEITDRDCTLFMWAVSPLLPEAIEVMKAWGFKYKTVAFCWNKQTNTGKWVSNLGKWTMGNVEVCLLGVKGKPKRIKKNIKQLVIAERTRHSAKPPEVRERIVELMGDLPRLEMFARESSDGWSVFGNQVEGSIDLVKE